VPLHARTPFTLPELTALTRDVAAEVGAGLHHVHLDPHRRWFRLLRSDDWVNVWVISWARDKNTKLHDHAGSSGALTVVSGQLTEHRWTDDGLTSRTLAAGQGAAFPLGYVHDVANNDSTPAVSVHSYSPPLTAMSYYAVSADGRLHRTHSELVGLAP
jgi:predicted metal-dependent enzyme (double-stranded beta helix superfamily)